MLGPDDPEAVMARRHGPQRPRSSRRGSWRGSPGPHRPRRSSGFMMNARDDPPAFPNGSPVMPAARITGPDLFPRLEGAQRPEAGSSAKGSRRSVPAAQSGPLSPARLERPQGAEAGSPAILPRIYHRRDDPRDSSLPATIHGIHHRPRRSTGSITARDDPWDPSLRRSPDPSPPTTIRTGSWRDDSRDPSPHAAIPQIRSSSASSSRRRTRVDSCGGTSGSR